MQFVKIHWTEAMHSDMYNSIQNLDVMCIKKYPDPCLPVLHFNFKQQKTMVSIGGHMEGLLATSRALILDPIIGPEHRSCKYA